MGRPRLYDDCESAKVTLTVPADFHYWLCAVGKRLGIKSVPEVWRRLAELRAHGAAVMRGLDAERLVRCTPPHFPPCYIADQPRRIRDALRGFQINGEPVEFDETGIGNYYVPAIYVRHQGRWYSMGNPLRPPSGCFRL